MRPSVILMTCILRPFFSNQIQSANKENVNHEKQISKNLDLDQHQQR